jgi:hypothetical protein
MAELMKRRNASLLAVAVLITLTGVWLFWNPPRRADMAAYVPADSLVYIEANDLPSIAKGITETTGWRTLSSPANAKLGFGGSRWLSTLAKWTGIGTTEAVVLARSQFAATLLELDSIDAGTELQVKLLFSVVIETHTSQSRMQPVLERKIEAFARRTYGQPKLNHKVIEGVDFMEWTSPDGTRQIVSAFVGTLAFIGNDEAPVRACIAVQRGARPSLAGNKLLNEMRERVGGSTAPLFGFASGSGLKSFVIATAPYVFEPSVTSTSVPQLLAAAAPKLIDGIAWAPHFIDGQVEDRYIAMLPSGVTQELRSSLTPTRSRPLRAADLVPKSTYSLTQYSSRDSAAAWSDLKTAISSRVDFATAVVAPRALDSLLESYGIDDPKTFLSAVGPDLATARLDGNTSRALLIAEVLDAATVRKLINHRLGAASTTEKIGDAEVKASPDSARGAVGFVGNYLLMGSKDDIDRCLKAGNESNTLATNEAFQRAQRLQNSSTQPTAITFTNDGPSTRSLVLLFASERSKTLSTNVAALNKASERLPYAISVTEVAENGFERTTRSSFGLLGALLVLFSAGDAE